MTLTRRALRHLWHTLALLLVVVALGLVAARLLLPRLEDYRAEVGAWLSATLEQPFELSRITARWRAGGPEIALHDVRLLDRPGGDPILRFEEVGVGFDLIALLRDRTLQPAVLRVIGTELVVERQPDGSLRLQGRPAGRGQDPAADDATGAAAWLFSRDRLLVERARVTLIDRRRRPDTLTLDDLTLEIRNRGARHSLRADVRLPEAFGERLSLGLEAEGPAGDPRAWQGTLYLQLVGARLDAVAAQFPRLPLSLAAGSGSVELWGRVRQGQMAAVLGRFALNNIELGDEAGEPVRYPHIAARFDWRGDGQAWRLRSDGVQLLRDGGISEPARVAIDYGDSGRQIVVSADAVDLEALRPLAVALPWLPFEWRQQMATLRPEGRLRSLAARVWRPAGQPPRFRVNAQADGLGWQPWAKVPGVRGLSGRLTVDESAGRFALESRDLTFEQPGLFRDPLSVARLQGEVGWWRTASGWGFAAPLIDFANADVRGAATLDGEWRPDRGLFLDLGAEFGEGDGSRISAYLPVGIMGPRTVAWLDRGIIGGRVPEGRMVWRGWSRDFPFAAHDGRFDIAFEAEGVTLDYLDRWPRIEGVAAAVEFEEAAMRIRARAGRVLDARIEAATAEIPDLRRGARLGVRGDVRIAAADGLRFLVESPLSDAIRGQLTPLQASGEARLDLRLDIPLKRDSTSEVKGVVTLDGVGLARRGWPLEVRDLRGTLRFSRTAIEAEALAGEAFGRPLRVDLQVPLGAAADTAPPGTVRAAGRIDGAALASLLDQRLAGSLPGETPWSLTWRLPGRGSTASDVRVTSELRGMAVSLPAPLGKTAGDLLPVAVTLDVSRADRRDVRVRYGDRGSAALRWRGKGAEPERGEIRFGNGVARIPGEPGLALTGNLARIDLSAWRAALATDRPAAWRLGAGVLRRVVLQIGRLDLGRYYLTDLRLALGRDRTAWVGKVSGEGALGTLRLPFGSQDPLVARLQRVRLARQDGAAGTAGALWPDPRILPPLDVTIVALDLAGGALGGVTLRTLPLEAGLRVTRLMVTGEGHQLDAAGTWLAGQQERTRVEATLKADDIGRLLNTLGYASGIVGGALDGTAQLAWAGPPGNPLRDQMAGEIDLKISDGRLVDLDPGAGRIFGLLSFQALPRRLLFDFRDFFLKGFSFDRIEGRFDVEAGDAYSDDLVVEGPAARVELIGRTGLARRDYDQLVTVIPNVTGGLPFAGWAAGGPAVGAVMLFVQRIFGKGIDKASGVRYRVTGPWESPEVVPVEPVDAATGKPAETRLQGDR